MGEKSELAPAGILRLISGCWSLGSKITMTEFSDRYFTPNSSERDKTEIYISGCFQPNSFKLAGMLDHYQGSYVKIFWNFFQSIFLVKWTFLVIFSLLFSSKEINFCLNFCFLVVIMIDAKLHYRPEFEPNSSVFFFHVLKKLNCIILGTSDTSL